MALQVWLPLDGTLRNNGLKNIVVSNNGATINDNGKIGKCYEFGDGNASTKGIYFNNNMVGLGPSRSICAWVYPKGNHFHYAGTIASSGNWNTSNGRWAFTIKQDNTGFSGFDISYNAYYSTNIPLNTWTHLCVTVENGITKFYKNGEYLGQQSRGSGDVTSDASVTYVGRESYGNGYFTFNGCINDVRIYDHCLSPKEVLEISKELVLHYKFDETPVVNVNPYALTSSNYTQNHYASRTSGTIKDFIFHANGYQSDTSADTSFGITSAAITLEPSTAYYLSFYCKGKNAVDIFFGTSGQSHSGLKGVSSGTTYYNSIYTNVGKNPDCWVTLKVTTGTETSYKIYLGFDSPNLYGVGSYIEFSQIMLSLTPPKYYIPYGAQYTITDVSGYEHTCTVAGSLTTIENSPRYISGTGINNLISTDYIPDINNNDLTISCWCKFNQAQINEVISVLNYTSSRTTPTGNLIGNTSYGGIGIIWQTNTMYNSSFTTFKVFGTLRTASVNKSTSSYTVPFDTWTHIVLVWNRSELKLSLYINGALINSQTFTEFTDAVSRIMSINSSNVYGGNGPGTKIPFDISDVRFYATALSATDILELYNIAASIDNNGNVFSYEFNEKAINLFTLENWNLNARTAVQWTTRNGEGAVQLNANNFYYGSGDARNRCFDGLFLPNTQYMFDMWIDYDDIVSGGANKQGGISIAYTDDTVSYALCDVGDNVNHAGWKHKLFYSDPSKSIKCLSIYYYTSTGAFYRWDSVIVPVLYNIDINKNGILNGSVFNETGDIAQFHKSAVVSNPQLLEI